MVGHCKHLIYVLIALYISRRIALLIYIMKTCTLIAFCQCEIVGFDYEVKQKTLCIFPEETGYIPSYLPQCIHINSDKLISLVDNTRQPKHWLAYKKFVTTTLSILNNWFLMRGNLIQITSPKHNESYSMLTVSQWSSISMQHAMIYLPYFCIDLCQGYVRDQSLLAVVCQALPKQHVDFFIR